MAQNDRGKNYLFDLEDSDKNGEFTEEDLKVEKKASGLDLGENGYRGETMSKKSNQRKQIDVDRVG